MKMLWSLPFADRLNLLTQVGRLVGAKVVDGDTESRWQVPGKFPLLLDDAGRVLEPAFDFLHDLAVNNGRTRSQHTLRTYAESLFEWFKFLEKTGQEWNSPKRGALVRFRNEMASLKPSQSRGLSRATVNLRLRVVLKFYEFHANEGGGAFIQTVLGLDPSHLNRSREQGRRSSTNQKLFLRNNKRRPRAISNDSVSRIYEHLRGVHRLIYVWALSTGLRRSSLVGIRHADLPENSGGVNYMRVLTKGGVLVDVPVTPKLLARTRMYAETDRRLAVSNAKKTGNEPVELFLNQRGVPVTSASYYLAFRRAAIKAGISASPHMTRHTFATRLHEGLNRVAASNAEINPIKVVQHWLGHASSSTTERYIDDISAPSGDVLKVLEDVQDVLGF